ncbi:MAG: N-acetylmuramoyl-L-alanine amidase [Chloroflexota bacterium]
MNTSRAQNHGSPGSARRTTLALAATIAVGFACMSPIVAVIAQPSESELAPTGLNELMPDDRRIIEPISSPRMDEATANSSRGPESQAMINPPEADYSCRIEASAFDRARFREPLSSKPRWNPPGQKRVGLQAGHWQVERVPAELLGLGPGATGGGKAEWEVNLDIARRTGAILEAEGIQVDILPTTIPIRYHAHAFVSIHADGDIAGRLSGYKLARPGFSSVPDADDRLVNAIYDTYGEATGLARDDGNITLRMLYYYAFNSRRFCHAVAPGIPQAIVETGFLTNPSDRGTLIGNPDAAARGIARGILAFLNED